MLTFGMMRVPPAELCRCCGDWRRARGDLCYRCVDVGCSVGSPAAGCSAARKRQLELDLNAELERKVETESRELVDGERVALLERDDPFAPPAICPECGHWNYHAKGCDRRAGGDE